MDTDTFRSDVLSDIEKAWAEAEAPTVVESNEAVSTADAGIAESASDVAPEDQSVETQTEQETPEDTTTLEPTGLMPPASFTAEEKAEWAKIPLKAQQAILRREKYYAKGIEEKGRDANFAKSVRQAIEPYKQRIQQFGASEEEAIKYLFNMERFSHTDPEGYLLHVAQASNVNLSALAQRAQQHQGYVDPQVMTLQRELNALKTSLSERETASLQEEISRFSADKPFFEDVKPLMATLLQSGQAQDLQAAYDMAVRAHPDTHTRIQQDQRRSEAARKAAETKARAEKAKQAAASISGAPSSAVTSTPPPENLNALINHFYDDYMGRAN